MYFTSSSRLCSAQVEILFNLFGPILSTLTQIQMMDMDQAGSGQLLTASTNQPRDTIPPDLGSGDFLPTQLDIPDRTRQDEPG
jgi:hypothetical protein